jgi:hypothetical protein
MSALDLPEDVSRWPENPYTLLGVAPDVAPVDLRRAYTRLIRIYKPEQFPAHFRRIREAYEAILCIVELGQFTPAQTSAPGDGPTDVAGPMPEADVVGAQLHALWEFAVAGEEELAYRRLQEFNDRHPGRQDIYRRLYWLLALSPALDTQRVPFDWLAASVHRAGWEPPNAELIRREIQADPRLALDENFQALIDAAGQSDVLLTVLCWRWQAATRLGRWQQLPKDLEALRPRVAPEGEEASARLLFRMLHYLAWAVEAPLEEAATRYSREIDGLQHLHGRMQEEFDQLEALRDLSAGWHALRRHPQAPHDLLAVVRGCWLLPRDLVRPDLWPLLEQMLRAPREWLEKLTLVQQQAPVVLNYLGNVFHHLQEENGALPEPPSPDVLAPRVAEFLLGKTRLPYSQFRGPALDFCLREAVPPGLLAAFIASPLGTQLGAGQALADQIQADMPLHCLSLAHRVFWM